MTQTIPVPRTLIMKLQASLICVALFFIAVTIEGATRKDYDSWQQAVSALSLGSDGWILTLYFILFGLVIIATVPVWHKIMAGGYGHKAYSLLTGFLGVSFIGMAFIHQDPAPGYDPEGLGLNIPTLKGLIHLALAAFASVCSITNLFIMAARFRGDTHWQGWPTYSRLIAIAMIVCIAIYAVWSTKPIGFAGAFERIAMFMPTIWTATFVYRLWCGVSFMVIGESQLSDKFLGKKSI